MRYKYARPGTQDSIPSDIWDGWERNTERCVYFGGHRSLCESSERSLQKKPAAGKATSGSSQSPQAQLGASRDGQQVKRPRESGVKLRGEAAAAPCAGQPAAAGGRPGGGGGSP